ncbi:MAG TPA: phosphoglucomutase [Actinobacteria bacterium]|nr:phosphoglucomutase [Actinomycetota bacterium]
MIKFGTDGWRAIIAREFTFKNLRLVVQAIGEYLNSRSDKNGVFIGYDNRFLSEEFALEAGKVLSVMGYEVLISDEAIPTPVTAFMVRELGMSGALMITASHNPSWYNGIKFIPHYGGPADSKITDNIESNLNRILKDEIKKINIDQVNKVIDNESIGYISDFDKYRESLFSLFDLNMIKNSGLKVAADIMNGAAFNIFPDILKNHLQLNAVILNEKRDPLFGGKLPDPSEKNLDSLRKAMIDNDSDIGLALDGDADRFGVIDRRGVFLNPNNIISLCLYYLLDTREYGPDDYVVRSVATTHLLDSICKKNNIKLIEKPVGFKYISQEMLSGNVIIGGEESGGLSIKGHIPEKDGLLAHLMLLEIQAFLKDKYGNYYLSDYLSDIYASFGTFHNTRLDIKIPENKKREVIGYFSGLIGDKIDRRNAIELIDIDGTKVIFDDGSWFLIRASGTEPLIRCYIESRDEGFFKILKDYVNNNIKKICN